MLPALASLDQLDDRLPGGAGSVELARALAALDDASALVRAEARRNWTQVVDDVTVLDLPTGDDQWRADILVRVTLSAALRALTNPEGVTAEQVGTYQVSYGGARSTDVYLTAAEKVQVRRAAGISGLWTQSTTRGECPDTPSVRSDCGPAEFLPVEYAPAMSAGEPIPWA